MKTHIRKRTSAAFTLIEIMVVVIILGILAATIIPQFMGTTPKSARPSRRLPSLNPPSNDFTCTWIATRHRMRV